MTLIASCKARYHAQENKLLPCTLLFAKRERSRVITVSLSYNYGLQLSVHVTGTSE